MSIVVCGLVLPACAQERPEQARKVIRSSVPTPRDWRDRDSNMEAYKTAADLSGWVCLPDPVEWWHAKSMRRQDAKAYKDQRWQNIVLRENNNTQVFVQLDPYRSPREGALAAKLPASLKGKTFASPAVREAFIVEAVARVQWYNAKFVCLAMEINSYYEQQPDDFDNFVSLFAEARQAIKKIKPDAVVFVSFQYEQLLGRFGGLAGMTVHEPHWELIEKFEPYQDAVGLSSYPWASFDPVRYGDPKDLPDNYYSRVAEHTNKPIVFTELGWSTDAKYGGSEATQAEFLRRFEKMTDNMDVLLVNYFFLYDCPLFGPLFESMGLLDKTGRPKEAFHVWKRLWPER